MNALRILITCEHGGHRVPAAYRRLFANSARVLQSHRGWDCGALELARCMSRGLQAPLIHATVTRLLVDLNRSPGNSNHFSRYSMGLAEDAKATILRRYYEPYRNEVEAWIANALSAQATVAHFSMHSFTPVLRGQVRQADVGLLYDPRRPPEKELCEAWRQRINGMRPELRVRKNYPYLGITDGFTTHLRRRFGDGYLGIELEVNQRWPRGDKVRWQRLQRDLVACLQAAVAAALNESAR